VRLRYDEKSKTEDDHKHDSEKDSPAHDGHEADGHAHEGDGHSHDAAHGKPTPEQADAFFMDMGHLFHHVQDSYEFEVPQFMVDTTDEELEAATIAIPDVLPGPARFSKFMLNELIVALILCGLFIWLGKKMVTGDRPKGRLWNLLETFIVFIRDDIAIPTIGEKDYRRFLPYLLTLFFFVLGLNLLGMVPSADVCHRDLWLPCETRCARDSTFCEHVCRSPCVGDFPCLHRCNVCVGVVLPCRSDRRFGVCGV